MKLTALFAGALVVSMVISYVAWWLGGAPQQEPANDQSLVKVCPA